MSRREPHPALAHNRIQSSERYRQRRAAGLCGRCGKVSTEFSMCDSCAARIGRSNSYERHTRAPVPLTKDRWWAAQQDRATAERANLAVAIERARLAADATGARPITVEQYQAERTAPVRGGAGAPSPSQRPVPRGDLVLW